MKLLTNTRENTDTNSDKKTTRDYLVEKICNLLKKGQSLYLEGESGFGKSDICEKVAKNLKSEGLPVATLAPGTAKEILIGVAEDLGIDPNDEKEAQNSRYWNIQSDCRKIKKIILTCFFPSTIFAWRRRARASITTLPILQNSITVFAFINSVSKGRRRTYYINGSMFVIFSANQTQFRLIFSIINFINYRISTTIIFPFSSSWQRNHH